MLFLIVGFGEDEQVIDVDHNDVLHIGRDLVHEMTKLTQELAVKLEQGRDLRQWHSMAN